jgi:hypothetical protein
VTDLHKGLMVGEHARSLFKLSEALRDPSEQEAVEMRDEAERMLRSRRPGALGEGAEEYDELVYIVWR